MIKLAHESKNRTRSRSSTPQVEKKQAHSKPGVNLRVLEAGPDYVSQQVLTTDDEWP